MHRGAIHGGCLGDRVSANGVGRRGHFPGGAISSRFLLRSPSGKCAERECACTLPKAGVGSQGQRTATINRDRSFRLLDSQTRPSGTRKRVPASPFLRALSEVSDAIKTWARRKDERRPTALAETRLLKRSPRVARYRLSSQRRLGRRGCPVKKVVPGTPRSRGRSWYLTPTPALSQARRAHAIRTTNCPPAPPKDRQHQRGNRSPV